jgi:predicted DNA-binding transcriptional regulator YafY
MSKRGYISRYLIILKKLKVNPFSTYDELQNYIKNQFEFLQLQDDTLNIGFSKRTLQRDLKEIRNIFGVDIEYSKVNKGYFISQNEIENLNFQKMIEAFDMFSALNFAYDLKPFIQLEKHKPQGIENLYGLLHAIKNRFKIKFIYQKFWNYEAHYRIAEPYVLKEFKNRWYLLANDSKDNIIKSFALDRLTNLEILNQRYQQANKINIEQSYRYCFGIINPIDDTPKEIIMSFNAFQGKYIKTLPIHESQKVIIDNEKETRIKLKLYITYDLIMEILSFGSNVKVIKPKSLINQIKQIHKNAFEQY